MNNIRKNFQPIEIALYSTGVLASAFLKTDLILYAAFAATIFLEIKKYRTSKDFFCVLKIIMMSIVIPSNYIIIAIISIFSLIYWKRILNCIDYRILGFIAVFFIINISVNKVAPLNAFFGLFYLVPVLLIFFLLKANKQNLSTRQKIVPLVRALVFYELVATAILALSEIEVLLSGVSANDWITGTFGYHQGNIFLYFMLFALLILKKDYDETKNAQDIVYIIIAAILAIMTNSMSLIIMFIFAYFLIMFLKASAREKYRVAIVLIMAITLFLLLTPAWIKSYIIKLANPTYFSKNVAKVQVYEDTFIHLPNKDLKFAIIGNGVGQYSSRAALTCTGKYIDSYNKIFPISVSDYTTERILKRYEYYNLQLGHGTLYSPFSTILSIQGEYGIIGIILFTCLIVYLMRKQNPYTKIFILFFFLSCFIENYLEFTKVMTMVFSIYFLNQSTKRTARKNCKKNLMFIVPTLIGGGAEKTVANLSKYLVRYYNVYIVVFRDTDEKYSYAGDLISLSHSRNKSAVKKAIFTIKAIFKLKQIKAEKNIDYAVSFLTQADILNVLSKEEGTKTFVSIRNTDSLLMNSRLIKTATSISCKGCDHIVAISNQVKDDLINNFNVNADKITTIYNPALKIKFGKLKRRKHNTNLTSKSCINVARLTEQKGQWHLIRAFSEVVKKHADAKLFILGQGPLKELLQELIDDYRLNDNVFLMGFVDNPYYYMEKARCFVFSSLYEGLGNALLEAMTCGTPIISCDCISGPRELLAPNTDYNKKVKNKVDFAEYGILVPTFDGKQRSARQPLTKKELLMAQAIIEFFEQDMYQHYSKMSRKRCKDFNIETVIKQWRSLLR